MYQLIGGDKTVKLLNGRKLEYTELGKETTLHLIVSV